MAIHVHEHDVPANLSWGREVAIDTETMGLKPWRDRLCLVQLSAGNGEAHLVQIRPGGPRPENLIKLLQDPAVTKIFHYARFDVAALMHAFGVVTAPVFCTKIAAKLVRTYTDRHGLKDLCRELLGVELSKQQQSSDWGADDITEAQAAYAASDVLYLHALKAKLEPVLEREHRTAMAQACFAFLPTRAQLDLMGCENEDIFAHS